MQKPAEFIIRYSKVIILITILLTLAAALPLYRLHMNPSPYIFFKGDTRYFPRYQEFSNDFGGIETILIHLQAAEELTSPGHLPEVYRYGARLKEIDGVIEIISFIPDLITIEGRMLPVSPDLLAAKYTEALDYITLWNGQFTHLLTPDKHETVLYLRLDRAAAEADIQAAITSLPAPPGMTVAIAGSHAIYRDMLQAVWRAITLLPPIALLLIFIIFYLNIRSFKFTLVSLIPALAGGIWILAAMLCDSREIDPMTGLIPVFVIVMGSADGLHFTLHYMSNHHRITSPVDLTRTTLQQIGIPMILTTITTMLGFLALWLTGIYSLQILGIFSALGILFAGIISFFFLPAMLSKLTPPAVYREKRPLVFPLRPLLRLNRSPLFSIIFFTALTILSLFFLPKIQVKADLVGFLGKHTQTYQRLRMLEKKFGSSQPVVGEFILPGPLSDKETLAEIYQLERELEELPGIREVFSLADLLKNFYTLKSGDSGFPSSGVSKLLLRFVPDKGIYLQENRLLFMAITQNWQMQHYRELLDFTQNHPSIGRVSGFPVFFMALSAQIIRRENLALPLTCLVILLFLILIFRNLKAAFISMLPISITVLSIYTFLYISNIHLNLFSATVFTIMLGIGIDYAIHLSYSVLYYQRQNFPDYTSRALLNAGPAILTNTLGIIAGSSVLLFSELGAHGQVAWILIYTMLISTLASFSLISVFYIPGLERKGRGARPEKPG